MLSFDSLDNIHFKIDHSKHLLEVIENNHFLLAPILDEIISFDSFDIQYGFLYCVKNKKSDDNTYLCNKKRLTLLITLFNSINEKKKTFLQWFNWNITKKWILRLEKRCIWLQRQGLG
ncbi:unnamed protein product [Cunninghamella echinulata]